MLDERWVYVSLLLNLVGAGQYVVLVVSGRVRPNRASWLLWAVAPGVILVAELQEGVGLRALMTLAIALGPLLVFVASFTTRAAYWRLGALDYVCGGLSGLALVLWGVTSSAVVAIVLSMVADALAAVPTVRKALVDPSSENPFVFACISVGGALTLLTVQRWEFADWAFPAYIFLFPGFLALLIRRLQALSAATASR